jgi:hypothetical protein
VGAAGRGTSNGVDDVVKYAVNVYGGLIVGGVLRVSAGGDRELHRTMGRFVLVVTGCGWTTARRRSVGAGAGRRSCSWAALHGAGDVDAEFHRAWDGRRGHALGAGVDSRFSRSRPTDASWGRRRMNGMALGQAASGRQWKGASWSALQPPNEAWCVRVYAGVYHEELIVGGGLRVRGNEESELHRGEWSAGRVAVGQRVAEWRWTVRRVRWPCTASRCWLAAASRTRAGGFVCWAKWDLSGPPVGPGSLRERHVDNSDVGGALAVASAGRVLLHDGMQR